MNRIRRLTLAYDENLASRIRQALARKRNITEKKMFGGIGFLSRGNILVGVWKISLIVRIGTDAYEDALREPHVRDFDITGKPMQGWLLVDPPGIEDDQDLSAWIERAIRFVKTLPAK